MFRLNRLDHLLGDYRDTISFKTDATNAYKERANIHYFKHQRRVLEGEDYRIALERCGEDVVETMTHKVAVTTSEEEALNTRSDELGARLDVALAEARRIVHELKEVEEKRMDMWEEFDSTEEVSTVARKVFEVQLEKAIASLDQPHGVSNVVRAINDSSVVYTVTMPMAMEKLAVGVPPLKRNRDGKVEVTMEMSRRVRLARFLNRTYAERACEGEGKDTLLAPEGLKVFKEWVKKADMVLVASPKEGDNKKRKKDT